MRKIKEYMLFLRYCGGLLAEDKGIFALFIALSIVAALTEGLTISLLVPILEAQGQGGFSNVPVLSSIAAPFAGFSPNGRIIAAAVAMAVVIVLRQSLQYAVDVLSNLMPIRLERRLNIMGFGLLMDVEISYIHQKEYGTLANAVGDWTRRVGRLISSLASIISNLFILLVYLLMMIVVSWQLTLPAVAFLVVMSLGLRYFSSGPLRRAGQQLSDATGRFNQVLMESLIGIKMVKLATAEPHMMKHHAEALGASTVSQRQAALIRTLSAPAFSGAAGLFVCALLLFNAALRTVDPSVWLGSVLLFLFLLFRLMGPVSSLNISRALIMTDMPAFDLLTKFYNETRQHREIDGGQKVGHFSDEIVFERVSFAYGNSSGPALTDVSFRICRGQTVAVVGRSGAGKTTLVGLLARLWDPQNGRILIDGTDVRELNRRGWRKRLAVVTQDAFIFNDTAANNIRFGRTDAPVESVRRAAALAAASEFIEELPYGYDTMLGDRGVRLSGGQQQRIAIARAILADPDILILDEATSHLDTYTERAIQDAVEQISKNRTVVVIAHRLSTIKKADKVLVLEEGRLVEEGRHDELLARSGSFRQMIEHQQLDLIRDIEPNTA